MLHGFGIEVRQFFDGAERVIAWLIVCSELERDRQCLGSPDKPRGLSI